MSTWPNRGPPAAPAGGWEERESKDPSSQLDDQINPV
jgi:hypothetical protein